jgi:UDP-glucose 4-epimerase
MEQEYLLNLLDLVRQQNGGVVLQNNGKSEAVVLSIERYYTLLNQQAKEKNMPKQRILVTGGAGYIGAHVVRELIAKQYEVIIVDNLSTGRKEFIHPKAVFYEGSVGDKEFLETIFSENAIDAVMHFAASLEVAESVEKPLEYFNNNVVNTELLVRIAALHKVKKFIFSSTGAVYGEPERVPIPESAGLKPNNPYGQTKMLAEQIIKYYSDNTGLEATVLRYFNVCGIAVGSGLSDTHINSHLIPIIIEAANRKRDKFVVNGNDYETFDGTCVRDYIHVSDIAQAHILALEKPSFTERFRVYNVGTGKGYSVEQMVTCAAEVLNKMIPMEIGPRRPGDAAIAVADTTKIQKELGFKPAFSDLETIFTSTAQAL